MIAKQDLRIGNWVSFNDRHIGQVFDTVIELCFNHLKLENQGYFFDYNAVKPIALTPSIFDKCIFSNEFNGVLIDGKFHFKVELYTIQVPHIDSLHLLQNFHYFLMNEELTITL